MEKTLFCLHSHSNLADSFASLTATLSSEENVPLQSRGHSTPFSNNVDNTKGHRYFLDMRLFVGTWEQNIAARENFEPDFSISFC